MYHVSDILTITEVTFEVLNGALFYSAGDLKTNSVETFVFIQRLKTLCTPAAELCNASEVKGLNPETTLSNTELHALTEIPENVCSEGESLVI